MADRFQNHLIRSGSPEQTQAWGENIGRVLSPGATLALTGELGSGKTAFTQGLARGLGVAEKLYVTSPSYTLINEYPVDSTEVEALYHIDLYRLGDISELDELGLTDILGQKAVVVIEWADKFGDNMWEEILRVKFEIEGESSRKIYFTACAGVDGQMLSSLEAVLKSC